MTLNKELNKHGLTIKFVSRETSKKYGTLKNWMNENPKLWNVVIQGCKAIKYKKS